MNRSNDLKRNPQNRSRRPRISGASSRRRAFWLARRARPAHNHLRGRARGQEGRGSTAGTAPYGPRARAPARGPVAARVPARGVRVRAVGSLGGDRWARGSRAPLRGVVRGERGHDVVERAARRGRVGGPLRRRAYGCSSCVPRVARDGSHRRRCRALGARGPACAPPVPRVRGALVSVLAPTHALEGSPGARARGERARLRDALARSRVWAVARVPPTPRAIVVLVCIALFTLGATFAAQAFQQADDARRGYRTLVVTHGPRVCLEVTRWTTALPVAVLGALALAGFFSASLARRSALFGRRGQAPSKVAIRAGRRDPEARARLHGAYARVGHDLHRPRHGRLRDRSGCGPAAGGARNGAWRSGTTRHRVTQNGSCFFLAPRVLHPAIWACP
jgi:hypothetical protein